MSDILECLPAQIDDYYEPFVGGGSVLEAVLRSGRVRGKVRVGDINGKLVNTYIAVKDDVVGLIKQLRELNDYSETAYYAARQKFNDAPTPALFIYLNKVGFRGLYRENSAGKFNVPYGNYKNPGIFDEHYLKELSELYRRYDVEFVCASWQATVLPMKQGDVVYLDPPYVKLNATTFTAYMADGFGSAESKELIRWMLSSPAGILYSNHATPEVKGLLSGWVIKSFEARRAIHSKDPSSTATEILAFNAFLTAQRRTGDSVAPVAPREVKKRGPMDFFVIPKRAHTLCDVNVNV
jgi:DNA adenine methylase